MSVPGSALNGFAARAAPRGSHGDTRELSPRAHAWHTGMRCAPSGRRLGEQGACPRRLAARLQLQSVWQVGCQQSLRSRCGSASSLVEHRARTPGSERGCSSCHADRVVQLLREPVLPWARHHVRAERLQGELGLAAPEWKLFSSRARASLLRRRLPLPPHGRSVSHESTSKLWPDRPGSRRRCSASAEASAAARS